MPQWDLPYRNGDEKTYDVVIDIHMEHQFEARDRVEAEQVMERLVAGAQLIAKQGGGVINVEYTLTEIEND